MKTIGIVLAAGRGSRMNSDVAKQYMLIQGKPVLYYSLKAFEESVVDEIIIVTSRDEITFCQKEIVERYHFSKVKHIVAGGEERYHSVYQGICACENCDYVLIHDGARPFITTDKIAEIVACVQHEKAVVVGMPVKDTIKLADANCYVKETPNRKDVWMIQTPQTFSFDLVKEAYDTLIQNEQEILEQGIIITDDAMVVEQFKGVKIKLMEASYQNIKITTPEDLLIANVFLEKG